MIFHILSFSCPLLLCSMGALFSEFAGCLALFLDGLITFSAFTTYSFTLLTHSFLLGTILSLTLTLILVLLFAIIIEKFKANKFIAALALNLFFSALTSLFSSLIFKTRGVLSSELFNFNIVHTRIFTITISIILLTLAVLFLSFTKTGLYIRITGSDSDVLLAKGISPSFTRILSWEISSFFAAISGSLLAMRICCFVPNISSGRGWMALAAVFVGKKKPLRTIIAVIIFCAADFFATNIQNVFPAIPSSFLISFPYFVVLLLVLAN